MNKRNQNLTAPDELPRPDLATLRQRLASIALTQENFDRLDDLLRSDAPDKWQKASQFARDNHIAIGDEPSLLVQWQEYYDVYLAQRQEKASDALKTIQESAKKAQEIQKELLRIQAENGILACEAGCWRRVAEVNKMLAVGQSDSARTALEVLQRDALMLPEERQEIFRKLHNTLRLDLDRAVEEPPTPAERASLSVAQNLYQQQVPALAESFRQGRYAELSSRLDSSRQAIEGATTADPFDRQLCLELLAEWSRRADQALAFNELLERAERALLPVADGVIQSSETEPKARGLLGGMPGRPVHATPSQPSNAAGPSFEARLWRRIRLENIRDQLDSSLTLTAPEVLAVSGPNSDRQLAERWHELLCEVVDQIQTLVATDAQPGSELSQQWQAYLAQRQRDADERRLEGQRRLDGWLSSADASRRRRAEPATPGRSSAPATTQDRHYPSELRHTGSPAPSTGPATPKSRDPEYDQERDQWDFPPGPSSVAQQPDSLFQPPSVNQLPSHDAIPTMPRVRLSSDAVRLKADGLSEAQLNLSLEGVGLGTSRKVRLTCRLGKVRAFEGNAFVKSLDLSIAPGRSIPVTYKTGTERGKETLEAWLLPDDHQPASSRAVFEIQLF
jgi:hypothetical protein